MAESFSNLSPQLQSVFTSIPMYVSGIQNPDEETDQQVIARQDRFLKLPKNIRFKLASFETGFKIQFIGQKYQFELLRLANITRLIREYYFGEVRFENFAAEIEKRMGVSLLTAQEITRYIKQEIIDWDPWAEYIAHLPKMSVRNIIQQYPKIADTEITSEYLELKNSPDLEDPTIKNWIHDYVLHLGQTNHSQMDRSQYLFHSENGKNLSSPDREKLGIILKSFDENMPLPVDEENGEIVFDEMISARGGSAFGGSNQRTVSNNSQPAPQPSFVPLSGATAGKQESFIKPYPPISQPSRPIASPRPASPSIQTTPPQNFVKPNPIPQPQRQNPPVPVFPVAPPEEAVHPNFVSQPNRRVSSEIDKYFNTPEARLRSDAGGDIPSIKIHGITERNEAPAISPVPPRPNIQRPLSPRQTSAPLQPEPRPKYQIIDPFPDRISEPRIDGNIVDLRKE